LVCRLQRRREGLALTVSCLLPHQRQEVVLLVQTGSRHHAHQHLVGRRQAMVLRRLQHLPSSGHKAPEHQARRHQRDLEGTRACVPQPHQVG